jgi:hypothetical protein
VSQGDKLLNSDNIDDSIFSPATDFQGFGLAHSVKLKLFTVSAITGFAIN